MFYDLLQIYEAVVHFQYEGMIENLAEINFTIDITVFVLKNRYGFAFHNQLAEFNGDMELDQYTL